jgi:5-methylcytosine-specific restriction endonuclease McrA
MMLKSCKYCGRIHDSKYDCGKKPKRIKGNTQADKFRWTKEWQDKRTEIKERDNYLCQVCIRKLYNTTNQYTYDNISVHHAIPLSVNYDKRLDNDNLITVCDYHHEMAEKGIIDYKTIKNIIDEQNNPPGH